MPVQVRRQLIVERGASCQALTSAQRYVLGWPGGIPVIAGSGNSAGGAFYIEPDDYIGTKLRVRVGALTNATAPVSDFTVGLFPITLPVGAAATGVTFTAGTVITSSQATITAPGAGSSLQAVSADFDWPTAGFYTFGVFTSAAATANSCVALTIQLEAR